MAEVHILTEWKSTRDTNKPKIKKALKVRMRGDALGKLRWRCLQFRNGTVSKLQPLSPEVFQNAFKNELH